MDIIDIKLQSKAYGEHVIEVYSDNPKIKTLIDTKVNTGDIQLMACMANEITSLRKQLEIAEQSRAEFIDVLERAQIGLKWYQDAHLEDASNVDDELHEEIDALLLKK